MNILPKKRWHVRTKDNIARVRRDEAAAKEEEQKRQDKLQLAESEARINFLRKKSGLPERHSAEDTKESAEVSASSSNQEVDQHVNLFADFKSHVKTTNKELEKEQKEEREKYEKQIGYLTYLGQDTNEALKLRSWYEVAPKRAQVGDKTVQEKDIKNKVSQDPLTLINALIPPEKAQRPRDGCMKRAHSPEKVTPTLINPTAERPSSCRGNKKSKKNKNEKKHKKDKYKSKEKRHKKKKFYNDEASDSEEQHRLKREKLEQLRKERLRREASERARQEALLSTKDNKLPEKDPPKAAPTPRIVQKYNSQFNPELAKQNMI